MSGIDGPTKAESTAALIARSREGDEAARNRLFGQCARRLRGWARGRLPPYARDIADTQDLVQVTLMRAFKRLDHFEAEGTGSFMAYLRQIMLNRVKEELRRAGRSPDTTERIEIADRDGGLSAQLQEWQTLEKYERALGGLTERARDAVILRLEFGLAYGEIADELDAASADAARMIVSRALKNLARSMSQIDPGTEHV